MTSTIGERMIELHRCLDAAELRHAFGGALALAWCTADPRGTSDIDVNVFVDPSATAAVVAALPQGVDVTPADVERLGRDGQARLWWGEVPVDIFLNTTPYHAIVAERARLEPFLGVDLPFLACDDVAVFKAFFFDRTRDWADLEDMATAGTLDREHLRSVIVELLGEHDHRLARIAALPEPHRDAGR